MIGKLGKIVMQMIAGANVSTLLLMLLAGYSDRLNPASFPLMSTAGLFFPILLAVNMAFLVFWVIFKFRWAWIPLVGLAVCYVPVRNYVPLNFGGGDVDNDSSLLKVVTYNVWFFRGWEDKEAPNPIFAYLEEQDADIVCLQELSLTQLDPAQVAEATHGHYQYADTVLKNKSNENLYVLSKYPVIKTELIYSDSALSHSGAFFLNIDGDTVVVVNTHLETSGLSQADRNSFREMIDGGLERDSAEAESRRVIDKLSESAVRRAPQADAIASYVERQPYPVIVCGDFNDTPISYAHQKVASLLTDCFVTSGRGLGFTYHHHAMWVRIDHIFCSEEWESVKCRVDDKIHASDHHPVVAWLKKRSKP